MLFTFVTLLTNLGKIKHASMLLFWISFWSWASSTGYLLLGSYRPFGDIKELIRLTDISTYYLTLSGLALLICGVHLLTKLLNLILRTHSLMPSKLRLTSFWLIIPAITLLYSVREPSVLSLIPLTLLIPAYVYAYLSIKEKRIQYKK
jgi:hypothetical protein